MKTIGTINNILFEKKDPEDFLRSIADFIKHGCADFEKTSSPAAPRTVPGPDRSNLPANDPDGCFDSIRDLGSFSLTAGSGKQFITLFAVKTLCTKKHAALRRKQFDFAKKVMQQPDIMPCSKLNRNTPPGSLFIFYSSDCRCYRLSLIECTDPQKKKQYTHYSFSVKKNQKNHTFCERMTKARWKTFDDLKETFSVKKLSDDFLKTYTQKHYRRFIRDAVQKKVPDQVKNHKDPEKAVRDHIKKLMIRLVFLQFLAAKGWMGVPTTHGGEPAWGTGDPEYLQKLFNRCDDKTRNNFLEAVLKPLFFETLNRKRKNSLAADIFSIPDERGNRQKVCIPYLPCGLFEKSDLDKIKISFYADDFKAVFDTFDRYSFTFDENDPDDKEVSIDPEMPGKIFENLLENNKTKGAFYTPKEIVRYMCEESLIACLGENGTIRKLVKELDLSGIPDTGRLLAKLRDIKICDPAIGSGAFPVGMMQILCKLRSLLEPEKKTAEIKKEIIHNNIYGADTEIDAVNITRLRLQLAILADADEPLQVSDYGHNLMQGNSLLESFCGMDLSRTADVSVFHSPCRKETDIRKNISACIRSALKQGSVDIDWDNAPFFLWHTYFKDVFVKKNGFDIMIGNPPYIGEKNNKKQFELLKKSFEMGKFYAGKMDYFYFFFHLALNLLRKNGIGCFITTNYFPTAKGAAKLRADLKQRSGIIKLCNFGELKLFPNAAGQHNMITWFRRTGDAENLCEIIDIHRKGDFTADLIGEIEKKTMQNCLFGTVSQAELFEGRENYIRISVAGDRRADSIFHKMTANSHPLGEIASVNTGIMGGCDNVNRKNIRYAADKENIIPDGIVCGDGVFVLDTANERDLVRLEELKKYSFCKNFYKNSDIRKYIAADTPEKYIIFSAPQNSEDDKKVIQHFLKDYRPILENVRKINKEDPESWFLLRRGTKNQEIFNGAKIVSPQRSRYNLFAYHEGSWYASADVYYITGAAEDYSLKFLLGLLNSKLYYCWLYHKGKRKGETLELYQKPVSEIPIPILPAAAQQPVIELVEKILEAKKINPANDTTAIEQRLDNLVYGLFDLTPEEITFVEKFRTRSSAQSKQRS